MSVFYITLRDNRTGEETVSLIVRQDSEQDARLVAEQAIAQSGKADQLTVTAIRQRKES